MRNNVVLLYENTKNMKDNFQILSLSFNEMELTIFSLALYIIIIIKYYNYW